MGQRNQKTIKRFLIKLEFLKKCSFKIVKLVSSDQAINKRIIYNERKTVVYPIRFGLTEETTGVETKLVPTYYAVIDNCKIIGKSNIILLSHSKFIYDSLYSKSNKEVNITDKGFLLLFNRVIGLTPYYIVNYLSSRKTKTIDEGILLSGNFSSNYYHFMYEFLVKFYILKELDLRTIPIIIDEDSYSIQQFKELIHIFSHSNPIILIKTSEIYLVNKLHIVSQINTITPNHKSINAIRVDDYAFDFSALTYLRNTILGHYKFEGETLNIGKRIYVSRNKKKRDFDESMILPLLSKYNFQTIIPEELSIKDQINYFRNAEVIIAASGAALTNILFCKSNCRIIVLSHLTLNITIFSSIAKFLEIDMCYIIGESYIKNELHSNFTVSAKSIESYLKEIL